MFKNYSFFDRMYIGEIMKNIYDYPRESLEDYFVSINEKRFKATQVYEWLYEKKNSDVNSWSNIKKDIRDKILKDFSFDSIAVHCCIPSRILN